MTFKELCDLVERDSTEQSDGHDQANLTAEGWAVCFLSSDMGVGELFALILNIDPERFAQLADESQGMMEGEADGETWLEAGGWPYVVEKLLFSLHATFYGIISHAHHISIGTDGGRKAGTDPADR